MEKVSLKTVEDGRYRMDVSGYSCPYPELFARRALDTIRSGDVCELVTDNKPSCDTVPAIIEKLGHGVVEVAQMDQTKWKIVMRKR